MNNHAMRSTFRFLQRVVVIFLICLGERGEFRVGHVLLLQQLQLFASRSEDLIAPNGVMEHVHAQADQKDHDDSLEETEG